MADYDAIVIGSGAGGLSAALKIAQNDHSVLLLEATSEFGGCLRPFQKNGYSFDVGVHYLGELAEGEQFWEALNELGILHKVEFIELDPEAIDRYIFPDFELRLCKGKERFKEQLVGLFPKEEPGIIRFFDVYDKAVRATEAFLDVEPRLLGILGWLVRNPVMIKYSQSPYQTLLDRITSDVRLQAALAACWFDYMLPPEKASVTYGIGVWGHYLNGAYYPRGGSGALRDAFVEALEESGAQLKESARVVAIAKQEGEFLVKTKDGQQYTSKVVVSDVDPVVTLGDLVNPELVPSRIAKKASGLRPSASTFGVFIGTDLDLPAMGVTNGNLILYSGYDINRTFRETIDTGSPHVSNGIFVNSPSVRDPDGNLAPKGHHGLEILVGASYSAFEKWAHLPPDDRGADYESLEKELGDQLIATAEHYIPDLSQHLVFVEYFTPLSFRDQINLVRGGIYGPELSPDQLGPGRFPDGTCSIEGLYLAGAGTIGGGVLFCVRSGIQAGIKAIDYLGS